MAKLAFTDDNLIVHLSGLRRIFGRLRPLTIAWHQVAAVDLGASTARRFPGARWGVASYIPGLLAVGSFRTVKTLDFWDVVRARRAIVIALSGHKYDRLVLEVDDPQAAVDAITRHVAVANG